MTVWLVSGSTTISPLFLYSSRAWVLQASFGKPLIIIAQEPQMADLQEDLKVSVPSRLSLICLSASRTVIPSTTLTS